MLEICNFLAILFTSVTCCVCTSILCSRNSLIRQCCGEDCCDTSFEFMMPLTYNRIIVSENVSEHTNLININNNDNNDFDCNCNLPKYGEDVIYNKNIYKKNILDDDILPPPEYKENL